MKQKFASQPMTLITVLLQWNAQHGHQVSCGRYPNEIQFPPALDGAHQELRCWMSFTSLRVYGNDILHLWRNTPQNNQVGSELVKENTRRGCHDRFSCLGNADLGNPSLAIHSSFWFLFTDLLQHIHLHKTLKCLFTENKTPVNFSLLVKTTICRVSVPDDDRHSTFKHFVMESLILCFLASRFLSDMEIFTVGLLHFLLCIT
jgi:hypothetical protein